MSNIVSKIEEDILTIEKERQRKTIKDIQTINISELKRNKKYKSSIKMSNENQINKVLLVQSINEFDNVIVYTGRKKIFYKVCEKSRTYKSLLKVPYKVFRISLSKKYIKVYILAYIANKYDLNINSSKLSIDINNQKEMNLKIYPTKISKTKMIIGRNIYSFKFKMEDILESNEEINNNLKIILDIDNIETAYKIGKRNKKIKAKKYYNLPLKSKYIKDFAIHIRRTIAGNYVIVKRLIEPIENDKFFRFMESKPVACILYNIGKFAKILKRKKVNLYYEKFASKAEEGVYELFNKAYHNSKNQNYFVIDKDSEDYEKIKNNKNVIKKYSLKYYWKVYTCSNFVASEAPSHLNILRSNNRYFRKATYDNDFIFLQHGIIYMKNLGVNSSFKKGKDAESKYMVVSSEKESDIVSDMLGYKEEQLLKTGLGMFSKIQYNHINQNSKDIATIMLTWKPYEENLYNFEESTYYKNTVELYNMLTKYINKENIKIVAHPKVYDLLISTDINESLWQGKISEVLNITKLLITDYSSICYNAFYHGAGVIFYQPDLELYEVENGKLIPSDDEYIGHRVFSQDQLDEILQNSIDKGIINLNNIRTKEFEERYKLINEFSDGKNIDRIYEKLAELKII